MAYFSELLLSYWAGDRGSSKGPKEDVGSGVEDGGVSGDRRIKV